jgi:hypothetical protein
MALRLQLRDAVRSDRIASSRRLRPIVRLLATRKYARRGRAIGGEAEVDIGRRAQGTAYQDAAEAARCSVGYRASIPGVFH